MMNKSFEVEFDSADFDDIDEGSRPNYNYNFDEE
jgi:hypothetical protein